MPDFIIEGTARPAHFLHRVQPSALIYRIGFGNRPGRKNRFGILLRRIYYRLITEQQNFLPTTASFYFHLSQILVFPGLTMKRLRVNIKAVSGCNSKESVCLPLEGVGILRIDGYTAIIPSNVLLSSPSSSLACARGQIRC